MKKWIAVLYSKLEIYKIKKCILPVIDLKRIQEFCLKEPFDPYVINHNATPIS